MTSFWSNFVDFEHLCIREWKHSWSSEWLLLKRPKIYFIFFQKGLDSSMTFLNGLLIKARCINGWRYKPITKWKNWMIKSLQNFICVILFQICVGQRNRRVQQLLEDLQRDEPPHRSQRDGHHLLGGHVRQSRSIRTRTSRGNSQSGWGSTERRSRLGWNRFEEVILLFFNY